MGIRADFASGASRNHSAVKLSFQSPRLFLPSEDSYKESFFANSEGFSHLTSDDIPQPEGEIFQRS